MTPLASTPYPTAQQPPRGSVSFICRVGDRAVRLVELGEPHCPDFAVEVIGPAGELLAQHRTDSWLTARQVVAALVGDRTLALS